MTGWLSLGLSLAAVAAGILIMRRMIDRRAGADAVLDDIRREVGAILTEMNQTTERNIELVEDSVGRLKKLLDDADRRIGLLRREIRKTEQSGAVYTHLRPAARVASRPETEDVPAEQSSNVLSRPASPEAEPVSGPAGAPGSAPSAEGATNLAAAEDARGVAGPPDARQTSGEPELAVSGAVTPAPREETREIPEVPLKERVLGLYRQGIPIERIASRVGTAVSEIELIVSLSERK